MLQASGSFIFYTMDITLLPLIETTTPHGVFFNEHGVAKRGLRYTFKFQKLTVEFKTCAINGIWAGEYCINTNLWGVSSPIVRRDFKFTSFDECVTHLWMRAVDYIHTNKSNVSMEYLHFKVAMKKWLSLSVEDKFSWFKESEL